MARSLRFFLVVIFLIASSVYASKRADECGFLSALNGFATGTGTLKALQRLIRGNDEWVRAHANRVCDTVGAFAAHQNAEAGEDVELSEEVRSLAMSLGDRTALGREAALTRVLTSLRQTRAAPPGHVLAAPTRRIVLTIYSMEGCYGCRVLESRLGEVDLTGVEVRRVKGEPPAWADAVPAVEVAVWSGSDRALALPQ